LLERVLTIAELIPLVAEMILSTAKMIFSSAEMILSTAKMNLSTAKMIFSSAEMILSTAKMIFSSAKMILSTAEMVLSIAEMVLSIAEMNFLNRLQDLADLVPWWLCHHLRWFVQKRVLSPHLAMWATNISPSSTASGVFRAGKMILPVGRMILRVTKRLYFDPNSARYLKLICAVS